MNGKIDHLDGAPPRLTLRQLAVFTATAREGSTRAAAERIARSQSAASSALADLEAVLGVALFDRVGRRLILNEHGRLMMPRALALLEQATGLQQLFRSTPATPLRVSASFTIGEYLLPSRIARWANAHPDSPVQMRIGNTAEVIQAVAGFEVEVGFIEGPQTHPDLKIRPWLEDELVIIAAAGHRLAGMIATARQLSEQTWIVREQGSGTRQVTDDWLARHLPALRIGYELGSTEAIKRLVAESDGLACVSRHALSSGGPLEARGLVALRTRLPSARRRLCTVVHRDRTPGAVTRDFLRHCDAGH